MVRIIEKYSQLQTNVRTAAAQRFEANRRAGGRKSQDYVVKDWNVSYKCIPLS